MSDVIYKLKVRRGLVSNPTGGRELKSAGFIGDGVVRRRKREEVWQSV